jgi:integrase
VIHGLFEFAVARGYAADNPVASVENVDVRGGDVEIFTPVEIARLLSAASPDFLPCIALGAFAGLRSAEIERLEWSDIDLTGRHITIGASKSKTASRRIVPVSDNLAAWLRPYAGRKGNVWPGEHDAFYEAQQETAAATEIKADAEKSIKAHDAVKWKANALRHSYASYRFAQTGDAGRVAGECGNSASVIHRHYRELVKPADAVKWFNVRPETPANVTALPAAANN